ncbi:MAG: hypothetical protein LBI72_02450 [Flavobacteriaceae bacterium]|jgi:uncharacterized membrane protein YvbJ|nr:hypothetical protein [Flavobacteriaceae bacterium]
MKESNGVVETKLIDKGESEVKENVSASMAERAKKVDREQYGWWGIGTIVVILLIFIYFFSDKLSEWFFKFKKYL